eukprot:1173197-Prymnesium_polylepis.1
MTVECRIAGNVRGVGCVPSRRSGRCTWSAVNGTNGYRIAENISSFSNTGTETWRVGRAVAARA